MIPMPEEHIAYLMKLQIVLRILGLVLNGIIQKEG